MFRLIKVSDFPHTVTLIQKDEVGKDVTSRLRVRFVKLSREQWEEMTSATEDDRLLYDVVVKRIEDTVESEPGVALSDDDAKAAIRSDMSLTTQIVDQYIEVAMGISAKNARASRGR
jgi:hypothetical protein